MGPNNSFNRYTNSFSQSLNQDEDQIAAEMMFKHTPICQITSRPRSSYDHDVFIDTPIKNPHDYRDLLSILFGASENDSVQIILNTPGGNLHATLPIIDGIKSSEADITAVLVGECHSAGSIIALNCPKAIVMGNASMMVHTAQLMLGGNIPDTQAQMDFTKKMIETVIDDTYSGFLSESELSLLKEGKSFWFGADEIKTRLMAKSEYNEKLREQLDESQNASNDSDDPIDVYEPGDQRLG